MNANIVLSNVHAVIFDLDGLLIDSERPFLKVLAKLLSDYGTPATEDELLALVGKPVPALVEFLLERFGNMERVDDFRRQYGAATRQMLKDGQVKPFPGSQELLALLESKGVPRGLATSSYAATVKLKLKVTGLQERFTAIVTGDEVPNGKPDPAIFLLAAERLGVVPEACLVLEDSVAGVTSALAAGMKTIGIASTVDAQRLVAADLVFESLAALLDSVAQERSRYSMGCTA